MEHGNGQLDRRNRQPPSSITHHNGVADCLSAVSCLGLLYTTCCCCIAIHLHVLTPCGPPSRPVRLVSSHRVLSHSPPCLALFFLSRRSMLTAKPPLRDNNMAFHLASPRALCDQSAGLPYHFCRRCCCHPLPPTPSHHQSCVDHPLGTFQLDLGHSNNANDVWLTV
ncbi:hypothetical protein BKA80DRAFT_262566, partial [Phyllosticta citrichinensis]